MKISFDEKGREIPDTRRVQIPLDVGRPPSIQQMIQRAIREEVSRVADREGFETFEESDDFDVDDEGDLPLSPHELSDMHEETPRGYLKEKDDGEKADNDDDSRGARKSGREPAVDVEDDVRDRGRAARNSDGDGERSLRSRGKGTGRKDKDRNSSGRPDSDGDSESE